MTYSKKFIGAVLLGCSLQFASAQNNYIKHTLEQGETLSMLAKQYNTSVGDIMRMNGMHADTKLVYGSQIKVPSTKKQATTVTKKTEPVAVTVPPPAPSSGEVTHIVAKGETLYSISKKFNISVDQIKTWNNLADENVKLGTLLIISESGKNKFASTTIQKPKTEAAAAPQVQKEPVVESKPDNTTTATPVNNVTTNMQPAMETIGSMSSTPATNDITTYSGEGAFADQFKSRKSKNSKNISGLSKTFKTASGWADGKFYILANDIEPGTIVKVSADNGTSVYAKVLWNMGDLKDNAGINFRVSNATAAALHVSDPSFNLNVSF